MASRDPGGELGKEHLVLRRGYFGQGVTAAEVYRSRPPHHAAIPPTSSISSIVANPHQGNSEIAFASKILWNRRRRRTRDKFRRRNGLSAPC